MNNITERILAYNKERLPELVKLKYEAMTENLFRFYRGTNHIFYEDLVSHQSIPESPASLLASSSQIRSTERISSAITDDFVAFGQRKDWQPEVCSNIPENIPIGLKNITLNISGHLKRV